MPIDGLPPAPATPPPAGHKWTLYRNLLIHSLDSPASLFILPGQETTYSVGINGPTPVIIGAVDFALARPWFVQFKMYQSTSGGGGPWIPTGELVAVDWTTPDGSGPNNAAGSRYHRIGQGAVTWSVDTRVGATHTWPLVLQEKWVCTLLPPAGVSVATSILQWRADVWVAMPSSSNLNTLNPGSPLLNPEKTGLQLTWPRHDSRMPVESPRLGQIAELTFPSKWDGAKRFMVDGYKLSYDILENGGYQSQGDYYFTRIPNDRDTEITPPPTGGTTPRPFTVGVSLVSGPDLIS